MKLRILAVLLFATELLLSTVGCSKKDDPGAKPTANTGRYLSDGRLVTCTATVDLYTNAGRNFLTVDLTTTPQPAGGKETLRLIYIKDPSEPVSAYLLAQMQLFNSGAISVLYNAAAFTLIPTSRGGFSGTFSSGTQYPNPGITPHNFTSGVFTDVHR